MPANPWELRADVSPLDVAATRWTEIGALMSRRGEEIVEAARRATEGWDAAAAESYDRHRREVLVNLDRFTSLATQVAGSLRAISSILTASQKELDQAWTKVALVPHEVVGESRHLVFRPEDDEGRGKVSSGQAETEEIRRRLALSLDQESARLRVSRAELVTVRTELTVLTGGMFGRSVGLGTVPGFGHVGEGSGVGTSLPSTSVPGSSQAGVTAAGLAPIAPISVSVPHLTGLSAAALTPFVAAAGGLAARGGDRRTTTPTTTPPMGGMAAGAMGARAGTMSRGMASGRAGTPRLSVPRVDGDGAADAARAKQAEREAKRAALEEKRAERAARKAEREKDRDEKKQEKDPVDETDEPADQTGGETGDDPGRRPAVITVVHHAPGEEPDEQRR